MIHCPYCHDRDICPGCGHDTEIARLADELKEQTNKGISAWRMWNEACGEIARLTAERDTLRKEHAHWIGLWLSLLCDYLKQNEAILKELKPDLRELIAALDRPCVKALKETP